MTPPFLRHLSIVIILLLSSACDTEHKVTREEAVIAVIGDSIANGYNLAKPWPTLLSEEFEKPISNTSVSGMETSWGLEVIDGVLETEKPTHLLISLGSNDAVRGPSDLIAISNLQEMVRRARQENVTVIIGNVIPNLLSEEANQRAEIISQGIAQIEDVVLVDSRSKMGDAKGLLADGVHPNQKGQQILFAAFLEALNSTFEKEKLE